MVKNNRLQNLYGTVSIEPKGEFITGTYASYSLIYTAGVYGMDDLGGLRILFRFACDQIPLTDFSRIRVRWEGAEFRARKRNTSWKGTAKFEQNQILSVRSFNFWNQDAPIEHTSANTLSWDSITSGNFQGFDVELQHPVRGKLIFHSSQINFELPLNEILVEDTVFDVGGVGKQIRIYRYVQSNPHTAFKFKTNIPLKPVPTKDERIFVKITLENGHQAWSSPMYFFKS